MLKTEKYEQGDLDGLCGLYAAINALHLILAKSEVPNKDEADLPFKKLFTRICRKLERKRRLSDAIYYGVQCEDLKKYIFPAVRSYQAKGHKNFDSEIYKSDAK
jgi:hypothetical protein